MTNSLVNAIKFFIMVILLTKIFVDNITQYINIKFMNDKSMKKFPNN